MKRIKVGSEVLMDAYEVDELDEFAKKNAINFIVSDDSLFSDYYIEDIIEYIKVNEYLYTEDGTMIPILHTVATSGDIIDHKILIAGQRISIDIEEVD